MESFIITQDFDLEVWKHVINVPSLRSQIWDFMRFQMLNIMFEGMCLTFSHWDHKFEVLQVFKCLNIRHEGMHLTSLSWDHKFELLQDFICFNYSSPFYLSFYFILFEILSPFCVLSLMKTNIFLFMQHEQWFSSRTILVQLLDTITI